MKKTATQQAAELIESRDLRFYGMTRWSNMDALAEAEQIEKMQPESMIDVLRDIYRTALANMTEQEAANILHGFKTCPPRPR
jgi:hypothetical protein